MFWIIFLLLGAAWFIFLRWTVGRLLTNVAQEKLLPNARVLWLCFVALLLVTGFGTVEELQGYHFLAAFVGWAAIACTFELSRRASAKRNDEHTQMMRQALSLRATQPGRPSSAVRPPGAPPRPPVAPPVNAPGDGTYRQVYPSPARPPELNEKLLGEIFRSLQQRTSATVPGPPSEELSPVAEPTAEFVPPRATLPDFEQAPAAELEPEPGPEPELEPEPEPEPEPAVARERVVAAPVPAAIQPVLGTARAPQGPALTPGLDRPVGPVQLGAGLSSRPTGPVSLNRPPELATPGFAYRATLVKSRLGSKEPAGTNKPR